LCDSVFILTSDDVLVQTTRCGRGGTEVKSVWEEFENNGRETELDELDRLFRGLDAGDVRRQMALQQQQSSAVVSDTPARPSPVPRRQVQARPSHGT